MSSCIYKLKGSDVQYTYEELVGLIASKIATGELTADDIVFSKSNAELHQENIVSRLVNLKVTAFREPEVSYIDGEPILTAKGAISTQKFIDSNEFKMKVPKMLQLNRDDFIRETADVLKVRENMEEDEAMEKARKITDSWDVIGADSMQLHELIGNFDFKKSKYDFIQAAKGTKYESVAGELYDTLQDTYRNEIFGKIKTLNGLSSRLISNLNLKAQLEGLDESLLAHIDALAVDGEGTLHIYNFKTTTINPDDWSDVKRQKYKYQLAFIKRILQSHGFDVKNIEMNLIPIRIWYNDDMSEITKATVGTPRNYTTFVKANGGVGNALAKEDAAVKQFIHSTLDISTIVADDFVPVKEQLTYIFPEKDIHIEGIRLTALDWIRRNPHKIITLVDPDYAYKVVFSDEDSVLIPKEFSAAPEKNSKIIEEVSKRTSLLDKDDSAVMKHVIRAIKLAYKNGFGDFQYSPFLDQVFRKYYLRDGTGEDAKPEWEFLGNAPDGNEEVASLLNDVNVLMFKNIKTGQLDFVALSPYDLKVTARLRKTSDHILGSHLYKQDVGSLINYKPTYGNIEALRVSLLINQILPKITGEYKLGKLHIVSLEQRGQGNVYSLESLNDELINPVIKFMQKNPNMQVSNNFIGKEYINPLEVLLSEYKTLMDNSIIKRDDKDSLIDLGFERLETADTIEAKRTALMDLADRIPKLRGCERLGNVSEIERIIRENRENKMLYNAAKLYKQVLLALRYYEIPEVSSIEKKLSSISSLAFTSDKVPNRNFLIVQNVFNKAIDTVSEKVLHELQETRKYFETFYDKCGYSRLQNATLGGQAKQFENLYERDSNNKPTLRLKNPYNPAEDLKDYEREFLKKVLLSFNRIRAMMKGLDFVYTDVNDPNLIHYSQTHNDYFNIPLERASHSTRLQTTSVKERMNRGWEIIRRVTQNPKDAYDVLVSKLSEEEKEDRDASINAWQLRNHFDRGEGEARGEYMASHERSYFETNLDVLLRDFTEKFYQHGEFNKALIISKALIFELELLKDQTNNKEVLEQTEKMINDFLKPNVFNASVMEESSKKIVAFTAPLRNVVSKTLIGGNIISAFRDTFEGVWQNAMRVILQYQTDIDAPSLLNAYKTVVQNSFTDPRSINIVNQLCTQYRLSNIDTAKTSEGLKTEGGIVNYNDWIYATLSKPDFLNRMVLFVAKCYKDGVYDAYSIEDGVLKYDWKKDKRFSIFASGDKTNPKYAEQMGAYYNAVRAYNQDHEDAPISFNGDEDPLPAPYSNHEIIVFKNLANSIYGAYDKSVRAGYERLAIGTIFGMFTTWMNGMYTNYMMKPGQYNSTDFKLEQATNAAGQYLFFDDLGNQIYKENGKYYYDGTSIEVTENISKVTPVMDKVPIVVQGIWYSLVDAVKAISNGDFKEAILDDPMQRKNLEKLFSDLLMTLIFTLLFGLVISPAYKEYKKDMPNNSVVANAVTEVLYKSTSRSYDGFKGILNVIEFLGENTTPPIYTQNVKIVKDMGNLVFGKKTFGDVLTGNVAVFKTFQDTYKGEKRKP